MNNAITLKGMIVISALHLSPDLYKRPISPFPLKQIARTGRCVKEPLFPFSNSHSSAMALISSSSSTCGLLPAMRIGNTSTCWIIAIAFIFAAASKLSSAAKVYTVGDQAGWIVAANYSTWASSKNFSVGDKIVFIYNKSFHNVLEVNIAGYHSCNSATPIATYSTGNDSIAITSHGHRFFICGFPGHCAGGQKVDIRVPHDHSSAAPAVVRAPPSGQPPVPEERNASASVPALAPNAGGAAQLVPGTRGVIYAVAAAAMAVVLLG